MTDLFDYLDFNAPLLLYELVALLIIGELGLSFSGCAAARPEEPARADMRNHDLQMRKIDICRKYKLFLGR